MKIFRWVWSVLLLGCCSSLFATDLFSVRFESTDLFPRLVQDDGSSDLLGLLQKAIKAQGDFSEFQNRDRMDSAGSDRPSVIRGTSLVVPRNMKNGLLIRRRPRSSGTESRLSGASNKPSGKGENEPQD